AQRGVPVRLRQEVQALPRTVRVRPTLPLSPAYATAASQPRLDVAIDESRVDLLIKPSIRLPGKDRACLLDQCRIGRVKPLDGPPYALAAHRLDDLDLAAFRLGQEARIAHHVVECPLQHREWLSQQVGRSHDRASDQLLSQHKLQDLL